MGKNEILALQCFQCHHFSSQSRTKSGKWQCKRCRAKQSITKVYAVSYFAKDIRVHINEMNRIHAEGGSVEEYMKQVNEREDNRRNNTTSITTTTGGIGAKQMTERERERAARLQEYKEKQIRRQKELLELRERKNALNSHNTSKPDDHQQQQDPSKSSSSLNFSEWANAHEQSKQKEYLYGNSDEEDEPSGRSAVSYVTTLPEDQRINRHKVKKTNKRKASSGVGTSAPKRRRTEGPTKSWKVGNDDAPPADTNTEKSGASTAPPRRGIFSARAVQQKNDSENDEDHQRYDDDGDEYVDDDIDIMF